MQCFAKKFPPQVIPSNALTSAPLKGDTQLAASYSSTNRCYRLPIAHQGSSTFSHYLPLPA
jgi:hypothetical protein